MAEPIVRKPSLLNTFWKQKWLAGSVDIIRGLEL